jgi:hypothetical protein
MDGAIVFASVLAGGLVWWAIVHRERPARFKRRPVMTGSAREFMFHLQRALPECIVCPQLAATALLEPLGVGRARKAALERIVGRRVGFAVFDRDMHLLAVIELDHRPKLTKREAECDAYFASAGVMTLRFRAKHIPSEEQIRSKIFPRFPSAGRAFGHASQPDAAIPFEPRSSAPWRNTVNAHH